MDDKACAVLCEAGTQSFQLWHEEAYKYSLGLLHSRRSYMRDVIDGERDAKMFRHLEKGRQCSPCNLSTRKPDSGWMRRPSLYDITALHQTGYNILSATCLHRFTLFISGDFQRFEGKQILIRTT